MRLKKYIALIGLALFAFCLRAQDKDAVTFELRLSKERLGINERLRAEFRLNGQDGDNFTPPNFQGFRVLMGPSTQYSSSWINGKRSSSMTYSYILRPTARGTFSIKQATIEVGGKVYKTPVKQVEVTAAVAKPSDQMTADDVVDQSLHLVAEVSKGSPYLNEAVSVAYKLYVGQNISVSNYRSLDNPKYNNFWSHDISVSRPTPQNGTYKGKPYRYVVLKKVVLYPQKSGKLDIEPLSLEVTVDVPTNKRDFFGGRIFSQTNKTVSAGRRTLNVKPLPTAGRPAGFGGAVGTFNFSVTTSKTHLNASESLQAKVEVSGKGNLKLFKLPEPDLPSALEVYEPEFQENVRTTLSGSQGKVSDNYTIVPAFKGKYPIPSISFSYFDPKAEKYVTLNSDEIVVNVLKGPSGASAEEAALPGTNRQRVVAHGDQFGFIALNTELLPIKAHYFFGSRPFYLWLLMPLLLIPAAMVFRKKRAAIAGDEAGNRIRRANKLARKYLSTAKKALGNKEGFYIALEKALHNYLKAKLKIETSDFSKDKIDSLLAGKEVDEGTRQGFLSLLTNCEMARYSPLSDVQMQQDYDRASTIISQMDKQI